MKCPRCGFESPPGFAFCGRCGTRFEAEAAQLTTAELDRLRRYLPAPLLEALQFDLPLPSPGLLTQSLARLTRVAEATAAYLPADLVARIAQNPAPGEANGRFVQGTLLFADISGFTAMSEKLGRVGREGAEEITAIVNRYLSVMVGLLHDHQGQVMKFGGDALLGLFPEPESALRAAQAALQMQTAMGEFAQTRTSQGTFPLRMKVGLHRGRFFAAQLGDATGMEYALFGADVNATAAAESAAQAGQVLLDAATLAAIGRPVEAHPSETAPGYWVIDHLAPAAERTAPHPAHPFNFEPTLDGLRQAGKVLEALTPYLPEGLLARLVVSTQTLGFEGEHRLVGVLFANVHGLGDLADRLGPGQEPAITAALNHYYRGMAEGIHAFGGVINKIDLYDHGDKLVVVFGAPVAHEDDAERLVRAALAMQARLKDEALRAAFRPLPQGLRQHLGVNFGKVFAGYVGTRQRREYTVIGDEVNFAARLMSVAQAGQIIIGQGPRRRLNALFNFTPRGAVQLKGKSEPATIFTVEGARTTPTEEAEQEMLKAPLVGRQAEWERLTTAFQTLAAGRGAIVSVTGEAGLGKTRLADELHHHLGQAAGAPRWIEGRCLSYTETVSYAPFQELIRRLLGAPLSADEAEVRQCLARTLAGCLPPEEAQAHQPYLANFLNLHLDPADQARVGYLDAEALQRRTFVALGTLIEAVGRAPAPPLILVLEDIHWIDQASRALLEHLLVMVTRAPVGWLLLYRPERTKVCWQIREKIAREYAPYAHEIDLVPLSRNDTQTLLDHLAPVAHWPAEVHQVIVGQTEGNPLYLEELLRVLIETGVLTPTGEAHWQVTGALDALQVPDTLEGVMMTRLDRLDEPSRNTAQVAAVIGRSFATDVLAHVTDMQVITTLLPHLFRLQQHEIAHETQRQPEPVYAFKHGVMQEVAYTSLLARVRRQVHRRIAEFLEGRAAVEEGLAPVIARHAFLGQDWPRALRFELQAGRQAQRLFANSEAIEHFENALASAEALPEAETRGERLAVQLALGELLTITARYDRAAEHLDAAQRLAAEAGVAEAAARSCRWQARLNELRGDYPAAFAWIDRGLAALDGAETTEAAQLQLIAGLIHARRGERDQAWRRATAALRIASPRDELAVVASANLLLGLIKWQQGDVTTAIAHYQDALQLHQQVGDLAGAAKAQNNLANAFFKSGEWVAADAHYRSAQATFEQIGATYNAALAENNLGGIALHQGRLEEAAAFYQHALQALEQIGASPYVRGTVHMNLGAAQLRRNALEAAAAHLRQGQALFEQTKSRDFLPELLRHQARLELHAGRLDEAAAKAAAALTAARELGMRGEEGIALRVLGEIAHEQAHLPAALDHLRESVRLLGEVADDYELAHSRLALARALEAAAERPAALALLAEAIPVFARLEAEVDRQAAAQLHAQLSAA